MDHSSQRELLTAPEAPIPELMVALSHALAGTGPALGFGATTMSHVPPSVAVVISTSGSTGGAKEVGLTTKALLTSARASKQFLGAQYGQVWSVLLPLTHIAGVNVLVRSLELGTTPIDLRGAQEFPKADFTAIVPTQLFRALNGDSPLLKHLQGCKAVLVGGAALSEALSHSALENGINIVSTYGMTETGGGCVYNGTPLHGVEVKTENGFVQIKGPTIAYSYLNDEESWNRSFINGWFVTNDLGAYENGVLKVFGRADDVIISGGENLSLSTIEVALQEKFPNNEFAAFSLPDPEWGSTLHIAMTREDAKSRAEIGSYLEHTYGAVAKPKGFLILSTLPMIGVGKVDRKALTAMALERKV